MDDSRVGTLNGTERAVLDLSSVAEAEAFFSGYTENSLGSPIAELRFRAGRIDAVWGVVLSDGREVVIKAHRRPVDLDALTATREAQQLLRGSGFPCAEPLSGPDLRDGRVLTLETLLAPGVTPNGRDPADRRLLAEGLHRHIDLLRSRPELVGRAGAGPAWCRYRNGPWPIPHDPIVDFRLTPEGFGWLDAVAQRAADQITDAVRRGAAAPVVGHADWYGGNTAVADGVLVATFDWELVAETEVVIAGFTAACYAASSTSGGGLSSPEEVAAFLVDYDRVRGHPAGDTEQRAAAAAATWILAFNARWQVGMGDREPAVGSALALIRDRAEDYLALRW